MSINKGKIQFITDPRPGNGLAEQAEMACRAGVDWVQFRWKEAGREERLRAGQEVVRVCRRWQAVCIVNDDIELARELGADGVHLGLEDDDPGEARRILGDSAIIGGTCNTLEDVRLRHRQAVDYIGLGPYRFTSTKKKLSPVLGQEGIAALMRSCRKEGMHIPIVAIGGIGVDDVAGLQQLNIHGIAVSSLVLDAADPAKVISALKEKMACKTLH